MDDLAVNHGISNTIVLEIQLFAPKTTIYTINEFNQIAVGQSTLRVQAAGHSYMNSRRSCRKHNQAIRRDQASVCWDSPVVGSLVLKSSLLSSWPIIVSILGNIIDIYVHNVADILV